MTQLDLNRVRQSIKNQIGSKIKISANRGRHKFVTAKGVITQTYPNIFLVELENADGNDQNKHHRGGQGRHICIEFTGSTFGLCKDAGQTCCKTSQTACGQVVAGGDQAAGNAQRDDVADGHVLEQVDHVGAGEEVGVNDANDQRDGQHHHNNGVVAEPLAHSLAIQFFGSFHDRQPP